MGRGSLKPPTSSVAISLPSVYTAQDINDTQSIISQVRRDLNLGLLSQPETIVLFCYRTRGKRRHNGLALIRLHGVVVASIFDAEKKDRITVIVKKSFATDS